MHSKLVLRWLVHSDVVHVGCCRVEQGNSCFCSSEECVTVDCAAVLCNYCPALQEISCSKTRLPQVLGSSGALGRRKRCRDSTWAGGHAPRFCRHGDRHAAGTKGQTDSRGPPGFNGRMCALVPLIACTCLLLIVARQLSRRQGRRRCIHHGWLARSDPSCMSMHAPYHADLCCCGC